MVSGKKRVGSVIGEDSLLERVTAAAEGLVLETLPSERVGEFYEEATRGRSAALALLYYVLDTPNPRSPCWAAARAGFRDDP
jgi:hypothetical protein